MNFLLRLIRVVVAPLGEGGAVGECDTFGELVGDEVGGGGEAVFLPLVAWFELDLLLWWGVGDAAFLHVVVVAFLEVADEEGSEVGEEDFLACIEVGTDFLEELAAGYGDGADVDTGALGDLLEHVHVVAADFAATEAFIG